MYKVGDTVVLKKSLIRFKVTAVLENNQLEADIISGFVGDNWTLNFDDVELWSSADDKLKAKGYTITIDGPTISTLQIESGAGRIIWVHKKDKKYLTNFFVDTELALILAQLLEEM